MFSRLVIVTVAVVACLALISEAGAPEGVTECAEQVSKKLKDIPMPANVESHAADVIKFMEKNLDADGNVVEGATPEDAAQAEAGAELPELDRYGCVEHLENFHFATGNIKCHRENWRSNWKEYDSALFKTNEQTHRAVVGARMCINYLEAYINDPETKEVDRNVVRQALVRVM